MKKNLISLFLFIFASLFYVGCSKKSSDLPSAPLPEPTPQQEAFWKPLSVPAGVNSAAVDSAGTIWAGTSDGVYTSHDKGATWSKNNKGIGSTLKVSLIKSSAAGVIYAAVGTDLYTYNKTWANWVNISDNVNNSLITFDHIYTFSVDKSGAIYLSAFISVKPDPSTIAVDQPALLKSTDGGSSWSVVTVKRFEGQIVDISFDSKGDIFVIMDATVYISKDNGGSWTQTIGGLTGSNPFYIKADSHDNLYAATGSGLYKSSDAGLDWEPANWTTYCISLGINSSDEIFVGAINTCFESTDYTADWNDVSSGLSHTVGGFSDCVMQAFDSDGYGYSVLESVLYRTTKSTLH